MSNIISDIFKTDDETAYLASRFTVTFYAILLVLWFFIGVLIFLFTYLGVTDYFFPFNSCQPSVFTILFVLGVAVSIHVIALRETLSRCNFKRKDLSFSKEISHSGILRFFIPPKIHTIGISEILEKLLLLNTNRFYLFFLVVILLRIIITPAFFFLVRDLTPPYRIVYFDTLSYATLATGYFVGAVWGTKFAARKLFRKTF